MRISPEKKQLTRGRILRSASELFSSQGYEETTTRQIARSAEIAAGTLFNYFSSKEAIATTLVADCLEAGRREFLARTRHGESLEEDLFALVAAGLRRLKPYRRFVRPALGRCFSPLGTAVAEASALRSAHLEAVSQLLSDAGCGALSPVAAHLYWTLLAGVLGYLAADESPHQEDTLAVLDQSVRMFVACLPGRRDTGQAGEGGEADDQAVD